MKKRILKIFITFSIIFLFTSPVYLSNVEKKHVNETKIEEITIIKHSPNGDIKPIKVKVELKKDENIDEKINEKCEELFENDIEIKDYISQIKNNENSTKIKGIFMKIKSSGKGFHFKFKTKLKICVKKKLLSLSLPKIRILGRIPFIYCKYKDDPNAITRITPLLKKDENSTKIINGNHTVFAINFIGFTSWTGRFSFTPFNIFPRSFSGIALFASAKPLR